MFLPFTVEDPETLCERCKQAIYSSVRGGRVRLRSILSLGE